MDGEVGPTSGISDPMAIGAAVNGARDNDMEVCRRQHKL